MDPIEEEGLPDPERKDQTMQKTKEERLIAYFDLLRNQPGLKRTDQANELDVSTTTVRNYETSAAAAGVVRVEDGKAYLISDKTSTDLAVEVLQYEVEAAKKEEEARIQRRINSTMHHTDEEPEEEDPEQLPPSERFLLDPRLQKILHKNPSRWTIKECGIIEVADCCYRMYRRLEGKLEDSALPVHAIYPRLQRALQNGNSIDDYYKIKWTFEVISKDFTHATLYMTIAESSAELLAYRLYNCYKTSSIYTSADDIEQILSDEDRSLDANRICLLLYAANYDKLMEDRHKLQDAFDCVTGYNIEIGIMQEVEGLIGLEAVMKDTEPIRKKMQLLNRLVSDLCKQILSFRPKHGTTKEFEDSVNEFRRTTNELSLLTDEGRKEMADKLRTAFPDLQTVGLDEYPEGTVEWKDRQEKEKEARKILKQKYPELALKDKDVFIRILWNRSLG